MTIKELVDLAYEKSPSFAKKVDYYRARRNPRKTIDLEWLMPQLEEALGRDFVMDAAQEEIDRQEALEEHTEAAKTLLNKFKDEFEVNHGSTQI